MLADALAETCLLPLPPPAPACEDEEEGGDEEEASTEGDAARGARATFFLDLDRRGAGLLLARRQSGDASEREESAGAAAAPLSAHRAAASTPGALRPGLEGRSRERGAGCGRYPSDIRRVHGVFDVAESVEEQHREEEEGEADATRREDPPSAAALAAAAPAEGRMRALRRPAPCLAKGGCKGDARAQRRRQAQEKAFFLFLILIFSFFSFFLSRSLSTAQFSLRVSLSFLSFSSSPPPPPRLSKMAFARGTVAARPSTSGATVGARRALAAPAGPWLFTHARERGEMMPSHSRRHFGFLPSPSLCKPVDVFGPFAPLPALCSFPCSSCRSAACPG